MRVIKITHPIVNNNTCPSVMAKVPHEFAVVETLAYTFMLCSFPTFCSWKVFVCKSFKGIVHPHHQYQRQYKECQDNNCESREESLVVICFHLCSPFINVHSHMSTSINWRTFIPIGIRMLNLI